MARQREVLTQKQVEDLINEAKSFDLQLMIMTFVQTGMRVSEIVNFKSNWIHPDGPSIRIQKEQDSMSAWGPKRNSERSVPITEDLLKQLLRHLGNRKKGYVFRSQKTKSKYEYRSIIRKINYLTLKVFGKKTGTHVFRATYASHLLNQGISLEQIRKLLGHEDIRTTLIYVRNLPDFTSWDKVRNIELMKLNVNLKEA